MYIACPRCDWRPPPHARWRCDCGHQWNTFATHGVCPACGKAWKMTQCMVCVQWSDHEDWYHDDDGGLSVEDYIADPRRVGQPQPT